MTRKITSNELTIVENELIKHLPRPEVEKLLIEYLLKLTIGTTVADHFDAHVQVTDFFLVYILIVKYAILAYDSEMASCGRLSKV